MKKINEEETKKEEKKKSVKKIKAEEKKDEKKTVKKVEKEEPKKTVKKETKKIEKKEDSVKKEEKKPSSEMIIKVDKTKLFKGIGIALLVLAVMGIAFFVSKNASKETVAFEFVEIDIDQYLELMKKDEKSIVYVARPGCSWCQKESPIIKRIGGEFGLTIYYLNTDPFWDSVNSTYTESGRKFINSDEQYADGWGTPNTIIVGNGSIIDGEFSYVERSSLIDLFVKNGFIDE